VGRAIGGAGGAVSASAATVICGIGMMAFGRFGKVHEAGLTIPFCLVAVLGAALTFCPACLRLMGRWVFWPQAFQERPCAGAGGETRGGGRLLRHNLVPNFWHRVGAVLLRRPGLVWVVTVALMAPFAAVATYRNHQVSYNPVRGLPGSAPSVAGSRALEKYFSPGLLGHFAVLLHHDQVDFSTPQGIDLVRELTDRLGANKGALGIADVRSVARPLGTTGRADQVLATLNVPASMKERLIRQGAAAYYVSRAGDYNGHVTLMDVVLAVVPFSNEGLDHLDQIARSLSAALPDGLRGCRISFSGTAATVRDLRTVTRDDHRRMQALVPAVVLLLLVVVFRRVVVALYLILSVLFSYLTTLGATYLVFRWWEGDGFEGLDWKVPLFLFTILVAVGEDYNIFLLSRVEEERRGHGPVSGVLRALARTGRIISTCGFIMAGTFAALFAGSFIALKELAFALSVGVLLDTLVVRPILVPTFLILLERRRNKPAGAADPFVPGDR
jgi:RND superfamily putative drug exporter